jgi:hypothetical protein
MTLIIVDWQGRPRVRQIELNSGKSYPGEHAAIVQPEFPGASVSENYLIPNAGMVIRQSIVGGSRVSDAADKREKYKTKPIRDYVSVAYEFERKPDIFAKQRLGIVCNFDHN